jgi:C4-dicarboxylate-specific signal transduction histidine kinase
MEDTGGTPPRLLLLERAAAGLAHEGKNPLHTMALHLHLLADKLGKAVPGDASLERHVQALRDGIGKVDALLRGFAELATPLHLEADLGAALQRALLLFSYEARRTGGHLGEPRGRKPLRVSAPGGPLGDLVAHAMLAMVARARGGGTVSLELRDDENMAQLVLESSGGLGGEDAADPHFDAARRLAVELGADLTTSASAAGRARLSLSLPRAR